MGSGILLFTLCSFLGKIVSVNWIAGKESNQMYNGGAF